MRDRVDTQAMMIAYVDLEKRLSQSPLLRRIKTPADSALSEMDSALIALYKPLGPESIHPSSFSRRAFRGSSTGYTAIVSLSSALTTARPFAGFWIWAWTTASFHNQDRLLTMDVVCQFLFATLEKVRIPSVIPCFESYPG